MSDPDVHPAHLFQTQLQLVADVGLPCIYKTNAAGDALVEENGDLTLQGELDKLAANIAIGRDFAGVHYYSDYYESLRMGERIAVGILQEQMLTYREALSMRFTSFDGEHIMILGTGGSRHEDGTDANVYIWNPATGERIDFAMWWEMPLL